MRLSILDSGSREGLKGGVHAAALCLAALIFLYNLSAWLQRRQRHLAINSLVYLSLVLFEHRQVRHHWVALAPLDATVVVPVPGAVPAPDEVPLGRKAA